MSTVPPPVTDAPPGTRPPAEPDSAVGTGPSRRDPVAVAVRFLPAALFAAVLLFVVRTVAVPLGNMDTYFHLRFGEEFLHGHWSLWHPGSVTPYATASWVPTQWLSEIVMAQFESWFGLAGVAWLSGVLQVGLVATLYVVARRWADSLLVTFLLIGTLAGASLGLSMRPQMLSFILVALTVGAWLRTWDDGRLRWWLVPATWLWTMLHGMWPIGIGLGLVAVLGLALDRRTDRRGLGRALLVPLASAVAAALTPLGPAAYAGVFGVGDRSSFFAEWNAPDYHEVPTWLVLVAMLAVCAVLLVRGPWPGWTDLLFFLVAAGCAFWSLRTVPVASVTLMPVLARAVTRVRDTTPRPMRPRERWGVLGACAAALTVLALVVPHTSDRPVAQPDWLDPALSSLPAGTPVVSDWAYAGYLMWRYPELAVVMHGYGDTFTIPELQRNDDILSIANGWDEELRSTKARVVVVPPDYRLAYQLEHLEGWRVVHRSPTLEMLTAPPGWATSTG